MTIPSQCGNQGVVKGGQEGPGLGWALPIFGATKTNAFSSNALSRFASIVLGIAEHA